MGVEADAVVTFQVVGETASKWCLREVCSTGLDHLWAVNGDLVRCSLARANDGDMSGFFLIRVLVNGDDERSLVRIVLGG